METYDNSVLDIDDNYQRGLLCQAKIKQRPTPPRSARWGTLSKNQKKILSLHLDYLALILYQYTDVERCYLAPFQWKVCRGASIELLKEWLSKDTFQSLTSSTDAIYSLGNDEIGTDDKRIIDQFICLNVRQSLIIHIGWPAGAGPPSRITLRQKLTDNQQRCEVLA
jgi:hypothetical protein